MRYLGKSPYLEICEWNTNTSSSSNSNELREHKCFAQLKQFHEFPAGFYSRSKCNSNTIYRFTKSKSWFKRGVVFINLINKITLFPWTTLFSVLLHVLLSSGKFQSAWTRFTNFRSLNVVDRVPAFQPGGPHFIPGEVRDSNLYPGTGCMPFVFCPVLSLEQARRPCWQQIQEGSLLWSFLVFWYIVSDSPYRCLSQGIGLPFGI